MRSTMILSVICALNEVECPLSLSSHFPRARTVPVTDTPVYAYDLSLRM
jgi:hypothetical protein